MTFDHFDIVLQPFQNVINAHKICSLPLQNKQTSSKISTEMYFEILYLIVLYRHPIRTAKFILMKLLLSIVFSDLSYEIDFLFGCKIYVLLLILNYVHKYLQNNKRALVHFVSFHKNYFQIKPCNRSIIYRKLQ